MTVLARFASRAAALALALALAAVAVFAVVLPLRSQLVRIDNEIGMALALGQRLSARVAQRGVYLERIVELEKWLGESGHAIRAGTDALAAADVQRRLDAAAAQHGVRLLSVQNLPSEEEHGLVRITLSAHMAGPIEALAGMLHELEGGRPSLVVDTLHVRAEPVFASASGAVDERVLSVRLDVAAYLAPALRS